MEKPVKDTTPGVFDTVMPLYGQCASATTENVIVIVDGVEILNDELKGWLFFKKCQDRRIADAVALAEKQARLLQDSGTESSEVSKHETAEDGDYITSEIEYLAIRLLSRHWAHRERLEKAFDEYWQANGSNRQAAKIDLLLSHLD